MSEPWAVDPESEDFWLTWHARMRASVTKFGWPIYGLAEPPDGASVLSMYGRYDVAVTYRVSEADSLEVTTGRRPLGGTQGLMLRVIPRAVPRRPEFPWRLSIDERNVWIPVEGTRTQFHLIEASTGHWMAAGGFLKRHLLLTGTAALRLEQVALVPVVLDVGISLPGEPDEARGARRDPT